GQERRVGILKRQTPHVTVREDSAQPFPVDHEQVTHLIVPHPTEGQPERTVLRYRDRRSSHPVADHAVAWLSFPIHCQPSRVSLVAERSEPGMARASLPDPPRCPGGRDRDRRAREFPTARDRRAPPWRARRSLRAARLCAE